MTQTEREAVIRYLVSIRRHEISLDNVKNALEELETRRESPPTWMKNPGGINVTGGVEDSKQQVWAEFLDFYPARKSFLEDTIQRKIQVIEQYNATMELLKTEDPRRGYMAAEIIRFKFYKKVKPDAMIYTYHVFCDKKTFYKYLGYGLQFFFDALPHEFIKNGTDRGTK